MLNVSITSVSVDKKYVVFSNRHELKKANEIIGSIEVQASKELS